LIPLENVQDGLPGISSDQLMLALPYWQTLQQKTMELIESYHQEHPLRRGIPREELKSRLKLAPRIFNAVAARLLGDQSIVDRSAFLAKAGHEVRFSAQDQVKIQSLLRKFEANPYSTPSVKECQAEVGAEVFNALIEAEELVLVSSDVVFRQKDYAFMIGQIRKTLQQNGRISLAEVRDLFNTSRKYAQALLEHLDAQGVTLREGDFRRLKKP
jgi:selenocysteine-specific elongation factor